jgi:hypothetical protein
MTTAAEPTAEPGCSGLQGRRLSWRGLAWGGSEGVGRRPRLLAAAGVAGALLGSQCLAASTPQAADVRLLLPSEGLLAGLGDGLRRGYGLAMEQSLSLIHI